MTASKFSEYIKSRTLKYHLLLLLFSILAVKSVFIFPFTLTEGLRGILLGMVLTVAMFFVLTAAVYYLENLSWQYRETKVPWYRVLVYMLPALGLYTFLLLAVFPGIMPYDSLYIWEATITNQFTNLHPIGYTLYVDALNSAVNSPWFIIAVQIVYTAFAFGMIAHTFEGMGLRRAWCWGIAAVLALYPVNAITTVTMLKDVNYMMSLVLISVLILKTVIRGKLTWGSFLSLLFVSLFALFSRHNALLTITLSYVIFMVFCIIRKDRKAAHRVAALGAAALFVFFIANKIIEAALGDSYWKRSGALDAAMMPSAQLAFAVDQNWYELSDKQKEDADKYLDLGYISETVKTRWNWKFSHIYSFTLKYGEIWSDIGGFIKFYFDFWREYPSDMLLAYQQMTGIVWAAPNYGYTLLWNTGITPYDTDMGIHPQSVFPKVQEFLYRTPHVYFWLRPAMWLMLSIFLIIVFSNRHGYSLIAVSSPMLANAFGYILGTPAQNVRYLYCNFTVFIILAAFAFMKNQTPEQQS